MKFLLPLLLVLSIGCASTPTASVRTSEFYIDPRQDMETAVSPAFLEIDKADRKSTIDTFTQNGKIVIGKAEIGYKAGDPLRLFVYNGGVNPTTFDLKYEDIQGTESRSKITGKAYSRAPETQSLYVRVESPITVPPKFAKGASLFVEVPDIEVPERWEFDIRVSKQTNAFVSTDYLVRVFMSR